jgi:hypothetical protein
MNAIYGPSLGGSNPKNPVVSLTDAPASVDVLYAEYCAAHARWAPHQVTTRSNRCSRNLSQVGSRLSW